MLSLKDIEFLKNFYHNNKKNHLDVEHMEWIDLIDNDLIKNWISDRVNILPSQISTIYISTMTVGFFPHCDGNNSNQRQFNIPISRTYKDIQEMIVFDQITNVGPITWCDGHYFVDEDVAKQNNLFFGPILPDQVTNHTKKYIDKKFYEQHLLRSLEIYWGLSPSLIFEQEPGDVLHFNPNNVHCTGKMPKGETKLGMVVRYD